MKKHILLILSLAFVLNLNIYFRAFPINFPQIKLQARGAVDNIIMQNIAQDINKKFPQFYPSAKDKILKSRAAGYKRQNRKIIEQQTNKIYLQLKDRFQDPSGQTYLMELDCWHWARYVENVVLYGHPGDEVIFGKQWDLYMLAPLGRYMYWEQFLHYFSAFLYKVFSIFVNVPLFTFLFYLPLFFIAIFIIVLYSFSFRYGGYIGAVISCLFIGLSPNFMHRSSAGWFDKDILNLLFPLLITWTYVSGSFSLSFGRRSFWIILSSFCVGLFCFTWTHWWFIFFIIVIYEVLSLCYEVFRYFYFKDRMRGLLGQHAFSLLIFLAFSLLWIVTLSGPQPFLILYNELKQAVTLTKPLMASIWPNVFYTVGELRKADIREIGNTMGDMWRLTSSFACLLALLIRSLWIRTYSPSKRAIIIIFAIWFASMFLATTRGVRFGVFLLVPLGISLGWALDDLYEYFFKKQKNIFATLLVGAVVINIGFLTINKANMAARSLYPLIDDKWYNLLTVIREKTPQQTILNSWWDYGDWFKAIARRRVIFDGQSQGVPQAYWMGKAILSPTEQEAISILRMLNNGGNSAFEIINEHIPDQLQSVLLLENILLTEREEAEKTLKKILPPSATQKVLGILFNTPAAACFIVEDSMLGKMPAISHLGSWDFSKVYIAQNFDSQEKDKIIEYLRKMGKNVQDVQRFYQEVFLISTKKLDDWLSSRVQFYSGVVNGQEKDGIVFFDNGYLYNIEKNVAHSKDGYIPRSLFISEEDGTIVESVYQNANVPFSILVFKDKDGYKSILLDRRLGHSMFARLYFFKGKGLKHFTSYIDVEEGNKFIRVFSINW